MQWHVGATEGELEWNVVWAFLHKSPLAWSWQRAALLLKLRNYLDCTAFEQTSSKASHRWAIAHWFAEQKLRYASHAVVVCCKCSIAILKLQNVCAHAVRNLCVNADEMKAHSADGFGYSPSYKWMATPNFVQSTSLARWRYIIRFRIYLSCLR